MCTRKYVLSCGLKQLVFFNTKRVLLWVGTGSCWFVLVRSARNEGSGTHTEWGGIRDVYRMEDQVEEPWNADGMQGLTKAESDGLPS